MTVQAGAARLLVDTQPERAREPIVAVEDTGRQTLAELRRLLGLLHQPPGETTRVPQPSMDDLDALIDRARTAGLPVLLTVEGHPRGAAHGHRPRRLPDRPRRAHQRPRAHQPGPRTGDRPLRTRRAPA